MLTLTVPDMHCGGCARGVAAALRELDPEARVEADPPERRVSVATSAPPEAVLRALEEAGFPASRA